MEATFIDIAARLGLPGILIWGAVSILRPMAEQWVKNSEIQAHALQASVDTLTTLTGALREQLTAKNNNRS